MSTLLDFTRLGPPTRVTWEAETATFEARLYLQPDGRPALWNGWLCPAFSRAEVDRIMAINAEMAMTTPETEIFRWDGEGDVVISRYPVDFTRQPDGVLRAIAYEDSRIPAVIAYGEQFWPIGAWAWTWQYALCTCGHPWHDGSCTGTGATLWYRSDYPAIPDNEPCACTEYVLDVA